jgi:hypothetical protein
MAGVLQFGGWAQSDQNGIQCAPYHNGPSISHFIKNLHLQMASSVHGLVDVLARSTYRSVAKY